MDQERKKRTLLTIVGSMLILAGYYLPWYSLVFEPPGGSATVAGQQLFAFTYAFSGLNSPKTTTTELLYPLILATFLIGLFNLIKLILQPNIANAVIHKIAAFFQSPITGGIVDSIQALTHIIVSLAWVAFLFLYIGMGKIAIPYIIASDWGGGADAIQASHSLSVHFGIGLICILVGLIVSGIAIFRTVAIYAVLFLVTLIVLAIIHSPYLGSFLHLLGF